MDNESISWINAIKIPSPEWILAVFWQMMIYFWKGEISSDFYKTHQFPHCISHIHLDIDHRFYEKIRYHVFQMGNESTGIIDESPYWIQYERFKHLDHTILFLEHGDYRHAFQLFIKNFLASIKKYCQYYPSIQRLHKILLKLRIVSWKCRVCRIFQMWNRTFIEEQLIDHDISIAPSSVLFLLSYKNQKLRVMTTIEEEEQSMEDLLQILKKCLGRFFKEFECIYETTTIDILTILKNLIDIIETHASDRNVEDIIDFERVIIREMKDYLYTQFKFIQNLSINHFPRDIMIARDVFATIVHQWNRCHRDHDRSFSPGMIILLYHLLFNDRALLLKNKEIHIALYPHFGDIRTDIIRSMTPPESEDFLDYHPLLRSFLFLSLGD